MPFQGMLGASLMGPSQLPAHRNLWPQLAGRTFELANGEGKC